MGETVLISTHRLELAGRLRAAFEDEGYTVDLAPSPDQLDVAGRPALVVLTGERNGDGPEWERAARRRLGATFLTTLPGPRAEDRGRALGADEALPADPDPEELVLAAHRLIQRRRLQETTGIIGETEAMREVLERILQIAPVESTVLITGESGTGKELVARGIHQLSPRRHRSFLAVNVAALSESLLESELFGHEKGAFTGAIDARRGFFELANRGTLFLDEIGEMPLSTQTKLLRVLEQREFLRVGGEKATRVDVRIIAATNQDLRAQVAAREFRRDLYYRLNILGVELPPLRERRDDIPVLIDHFVRELASRIDRRFPGITPRAMEILEAYDWPGNVRELRNLVESMVVLSPGREIEPEDIPAEIRSPREASRLLPVPYLPPGYARPAGAGAERGGEGGTGGEAGGRTGLRPELEFVFRTLMELRVDMDQLRREFEAYRDGMEDRLVEAPLRGSPWTLPGGAPGVEIGVRPGRRAPVGFPDEEVPESGMPSVPTGERDTGPTSRVPEAGPEEDAEGDEEAVVFRPGMTMEELEEEAIRAILRETAGNRRKAAESLGIGERTLYRKIKKYGIEV
jgi:DNA-binding NtrC family response regulator